MRILRVLLIAFFVGLAAHLLYASWEEEFYPIGSQVQVQLTEGGTNLYTISCELTRWAPEDREIEGESYQVFPFIGEAVAGPDGYPELPAIVRFVLMPPQAGAELRIKERSTRTLSNIHPLPFSNPLAIADHYNTLESPSPSDRSLKKVDYSSLGEGFWPPEPVKLGEPAILRNYRILPIVFYPLRYNPHTLELEVTDWIEVELDFNSSHHRINLLSEGDQAKSSPVLTHLISQTVLNPPSPERDPVRLGGSVVYIVGQGQSWDEVVNELQPLIEWRRRQGWKTVILRVNNPSTPANVVQALQQAYRNWSDPPEYVVLVGDTDGSFPIGFFDMRRGAAYPYESDHPFTQLDGDDLLPEAVVGRIIYDNTNRLRGIVNKIVQYESDPYVGQGNEVGWQKRAALAAGDSRSGITSIDILRWTKKILIERWDYQQVNERYWSANEPQPNCRDFIINNINSGISFLVYRGWTFVSGYQFADVDNQRNGRMLPFTILATCNTGDYGEHVSSPFYYTERFIYHPNGGAIGSVGAAGATHTAYNNIYTTGLLKAALLDSITYQGWAHWAGKWQLYIHYAGRGDHNHPENNQMEAWLTEFYIFNLMGDPTTQLYTTTPQNLIVRAPQNIRQGETHIEVEVLYDREEDIPASGLNVCLYKP
ncbi:MAG: C25 family cysteine peptidase, partial [bacterium]